MKRVAWLRLHEHLEQIRDKEEDLTKKWKATRKLLSDLETKHPEYAKVWLDRYNEERRKNKIPDYILGPGEEELYQKTLI
jgi:vacuolar-type H+-ATPase subunit I/STV1